MEDSLDDAVYIDVMISYRVWTWIKDYYIYTGVLINPNNPNTQQKFRKGRFSSKRHDSAFEKVAFEGRRIYQLLVTTT